MIFYSLIALLNAVIVLFHMFKPDAVAEAQYLAATVGFWASLILAKLEAQHKLLGE